MEAEYIIKPQTKQMLLSLAQKYEVPAFTLEDPSQFLCWYSSPADIEPACFIAAMLSFGSRKQFIPKIKQIFELADKAGGMAAWLKSGRYRKDFACSDCKFYRFYSYSDMLDLFSNTPFIGRTGRACSSPCTPAAFLCRKKALPGTNGK